MKIAHVVLPPPQTETANWLRVKITAWHIQYLMVKLRRDLNVQPLERRQDPKANW